MDLLRFHVAVAAYRNAPPKKNPRPERMTTFFLLVLGELRPASSEKKLAEV